MVMPANGDPDLVERSGDLKGEVVEFALGPRFARTLDKELDQYFGDVIVVDEEVFANFLDWFILQHRLPGDRRVVDHFVAAHPELPEAERAMLSGWRDVVEGIFEIKRRDGEALVVENLVDELTYRVRSNMGAAALRPMRPRSYLIARLVPVGEEWILSGMSSLLPAASRDAADEIALGLVARAPELVFRNPEKLEHALALQRQELRHFIAFFGADEVVLPGREMAERMRAYTHYRIYDARDDEGKTSADRMAATYGVDQPPLDFELPAALTAAKTVGMIFDEIEGLNYFVDFGLVAETFADPALAADRTHRQAVLGYLKDKDFTPLPLRRLAARDPARASQVFRRILNLKQRDFSWERDGEPLLRRYKPGYFTQPMLPSMTVLSERLARAQMAAHEPPRKRHWWQR
jgi:hypothetical protein